MFQPEGLHSKKPNLEERRRRNKTLYGLILIYVDNVIIFSKFFQNLGMVKLELSKSLKIKKLHF